MKIKTEIEQLKDRKNEVWASYSFQMQQVKYRKAEKKSMENTFFKIMSQIRLITQEIEEMEKIALFLFEYYQSLIVRIDELEK